MRRFRAGNHNDASILDVRELVELDFIARLQGDDALLESAGGNAGACDRFLRCRVDGIIPRVRHRVNRLTREGDLFHAVRGHLAQET